MIYRILKLLSTTYPKTLITSTIADCKDLDVDEVHRALVGMLEYHEPYGALVELCQDGWRIAGRQDFDTSTGGWAWLDDTHANPRKIEKTQEWNNEVSTGMKLNGKQTKIKDAVLQGGGSYEGATCNDPEDKAHRTNRKFMGGE